MGMGREEIYIPHVRFRRGFGGVLAECCFNLYQTEKLHNVGSRRYLPGFSCVYWKSVRKAAREEGLILQKGVTV